MGNKNRSQRRRAVAVSWDSIEKMEQARWMRFAAEHPSEVICADVISAGHCTQAQAAQMGRLAAERSWTIPSVGKAAAARRRKAAAKS